MRRLTVPRAPVIDAETLSFFAAFTRKTVEQRLPLTGSLELTARCNLSCVHCYLGRLRHDSEQRRQELGTGRILSLLDEIAAAGCLNLLLTGGEPLCHADFAAIYTRAKTNGLLVTVFTNGTLLNEGTAGLFEDLPPQAVEISIYGATAATHESVTGVAGSFRKCLDGIDALLGRGVNLRLKTIMMSLNVHEFEAIAKLAADIGVKLRVDAGLFPGFDGDRSPLALRVDPLDVVEKEFADPARLLLWQDYYARVPQSADSGRLYDCGAGVTNFHLDARGKLSPCLMTAAIKHDPTGGSFADDWRALTGIIDAKRSSAGFACRGCSKKALCGYCPAFFALENGHEQAHSRYLCALGERRLQKLTSRGAMHAQEH